MQFIVSNQTNPYWNIAVENYLVGRESEAVVLYLWQNRRTVVIGQNQNPYSEVNLEALLADGGYLMRRRTGGGALGNLFPLTGLMIPGGDVFTFTYAVTFPVMVVGFVFAAFSYVFEYGGKLQQESDETL